MSSKWRGITLLIRPGKGLLRGFWKGRCAGQKPQILGKQYVFPPGRESQDQLSPLSRILAGSWEFHHVPWRDLWGVLWKYGGTRPLNTGRSNFAFLGGVYGHHDCFRSHCARSCDVAQCTAQDFSENARYLTLAGHGNVTSIRWWSTSLATTPLTEPQNYVYWRKGSKGGEVCEDPLIQTRIRNQCWGWSLLKLIFFQACSGLPKTKHWRKRC